MYTLYYSPGTASMCVHQALIEADAQYRLVLVDLQAGQQRDPAYLRLNPGGVVPTLLIDDAPFTETAGLLMTIATRARCAACQQRTNLRSRCPRRSWPDSGPTSWDWPIFGEWSAGGNSTRLSSPVACRVPRSRSSAQPVAPSPRIHEMDRECARAPPRIAKRTASL
jgi:hypothetical protein